jgi:hypothetical protein
MQEDDMAGQKVHSDDSMPSKLDDDIKRLNLIMPTALTRKVDDWRGRQDDVPNFSEAVRRLLEIAIESEKKSGKRGR